MSAAEQLPFAWLGDVPARLAPAKGKWAPRSEPHRTVLDGDLARCADLARLERWTLDVAADLDARVAASWFSPLYRRRPELVCLGCMGADAMEMGWGGAAWCHPPWEDLDAWVERAWSEASRHSTPESLVALHTIGMLVPADTAAPWWQRGIEPHRDGRLSRVPMWTLETYQLGRLRFSRPGGGELSTATPCALIVWRREGIFQGRW